MKTINPISIYYNGQMINAVVLNTYCVNDNLSSEAKFYFALYSSEFVILSQGNLLMTGADYTAYETNQYAWDWVAQQLNVTITGDYVPPTTN